jgi:hypothetical protein
MQVSVNQLDIAIQVHAGCSYAPLSWSLTRVAASGLAGGTLAGGSNRCGRGRFALRAYTWEVYSGDPFLS